MICPSCKRHMIVVEYQKIELDYCHNCQGVWFDAGELELMLDSVINGGEAKAFINTLIKSPEVATNEKKRRCPICRRKMRKVNISEANRVLIDTCMQEDGMWFDGGEVDHLVKLLSEKSPQKLGSHKAFDFIKEVFQSK